MHQIDLMVSAKKAEWENHLHAVQIQLEKRNKELGFTKAQLEQKTDEVIIFNGQTTYSTYKIYVPVIIILLFMSR